MLRLNFLVLYIVVTAILSLKSSSALAETIDLGASEIQGKKDAPEAMTFISRAPLDESGEVFKFDGKAKIKEEIKTSKLFDLVYSL